MDNRGVVTSIATTTIHAELMAMSNSSGRYGNGDWAIFHVNEAELKIVNDYVKLGYVFDPLS